MTAEDDLAASFASTKVEYKYLGKSGLRVSVPIVGCMSYGSSKWQPWVLDDKEALPLLKAAYDRGLNTWDTANVYSNGESERVVGKALREYSIPRHKVFILTKLFSAVPENAELFTFGKEDLLSHSKDYTNLYGLSRSAIFHEVDASLKRLGTDYIDLLQIHRYDPNTPPEETMEALNDVVRSGKVRYIGASSMWAYQFATLQHVAESRGWTKFVSMQNHYSLLYREEEREMIKFCNETGVGLIPWAPLARGQLSRPVDTTPTTRAKATAHRMVPLGDPSKVIIGRVEEIAKKRGWTMTQVALAWTSKRVTSPIVGLNSIARLEEATDLRGKELTAEEAKYLEEPYQPLAVQGHA